MHVTLADRNTAVTRDTHDERVNPGLAQPGQHRMPQSVNNKFIRPTQFLTNLRVAVIQMRNSVRTPAPVGEYELVYRLAFPRQQ